MEPVSRTLRFAWPVAVLLLVPAVAINVASWGTAIRNPQDVALLLALTLLAFATDEFSLPALRVDIGLILAFAALVLTGPMGALIVVVIPELIRPVVERHPVRRIATAANLASLAWQVVAGEAVLRALPAAHASTGGRVLIYGLATVVMALATGVVTRGIVAGLVDRILVSGWRTELSTLVACLALAPFAVLIAELLPVIGVLALVAAALAQVSLGVLVRLVTWTPHASRLTVPEARAHYAAALASRMSLTRSEQRVLVAATRTGCGRPDVRLLSSFERDRVAKTLILAGLRSGSADCFTRLAPAEMGIESRILVVAHGWAQLTAAGTDELEHRIALLTLHNNPRRYDRGIVAVARELIPASEPEAARVPYVHALPRRIAQLRLVA
jgi:ABC-type amino acid transport substrate-binding protein